MARPIAADRTLVESWTFRLKGAPDELLHIMARDTAWLLRAYGLPTTYAAGGVGDGWCDHHALGAKGGGHTDICSPGDGIIERLGGFIKQAYDDFGDGPLPVWALHGLPNPNTVSLPSGPALPSHDGQPRTGKYDAVQAHPGLTGFADGSVADWQHRLKMVGANPELAIDGDEGAATRAAIGVFQKAEGLPVTNEVNPATWAALVRATG